MSGPIVLAIRIILTLGLLTFLGWIFFTLWQNVQRQGVILSSRKVPGIHIDVRRESLPPYTRLFTQPEIIIGRDPNSDIQLSEDTASAKHARLKFHHGQWWLDDLESKNGTKLNGSLLTTPTVIISNDQIACGKTILNIRLQSDTTVTTTQNIKPEREYD